MIVVGVPFACSYSQECLPHLNPHDHLVTTQTVLKIILLYLPNLGEFDLRPSAQSQMG